MRKIRCQSNLRFSYSRKAVSREAFSLAELVISIGILILMMALAGQVFTITVRSTGQATALTETSQQLRMFEETIREDLRNVQPGQSVILIQGNPVNAYWTQVQKESDAVADGRPETGYPFVSDPQRERLDATGNPVKGADGGPLLEMPRADILMFFTSRRGSSYVRPGVTGRLQQVVYGHAELGDYERDPTAGATGDPYVFTPDPSIAGQSAFPVDPTTNYPSLAIASSVPASEWHLARRSVLMAPTPGSTSADLGWNSDFYGPNRKGLGDDRLLKGETDVVWGFSFDQLVLRSGSVAPWYLPTIFYDPNQLFVSPFARSWLDPAPPPVYASRMAAYFLPNCASFKVEWSLDPRSPFVAGRLDGTNEVFWIDPGDIGDATRPTFLDPDPLYALQAKITELGMKTDAVSNRLRNSLRSLLCDQTQHADGRFYSLADRFRGVTCPGFDANQEWDQLAAGGRRPNLEVFTAARPSNTVSDAPDDVWPGALRITVDVFDRERRLERPIRHVMIVPVGD